ncbi:hypothetical protein DSO57_1007002 [Entomophthora muscae]|uniref:Uncharacterized protein n=1 Tax=Entomophthora muscae TaxID=34485 RepID=A0ACC2USG4_9FUNG|nr:hypothetical protein DSO57_1007002 [Entomophthora muscae]
MPAQGNIIYAWDSWSLLLGVDKIFQQMRDVANREIEVLKLWEEKSVEIMIKWENENKGLNQKIVSLETKLTKALLQEGSNNKGLNKNDYGYHYSREPQKPGPYLV